MLLDTSARETLLTAHGLRVAYGPVEALRGADLELRQGEFVALVGANGAGKSTLVNALCGMLPLLSGELSVQGKITQAPEGRQLFAGLTVLENLELGGWGRSRKQRAASLESILEVLPEVRRFLRQTAGTLSGGQQQMVAIGRALMSAPAILAVDELSLGLAPKIVLRLLEHLRELNTSQGLTVLLVEQNARLAFRFSERAYVLEAGATVRSGLSKDLALDPSVVESYLGAS